MEQSSVTELPVCGAERREEGLNKAVKQGDCSARERRCLVHVRQQNKLELGTVKLQQMPGLTWLQLVCGEICYALTCSSAGFMAGLDDLKCLFQPE